jgi:hypothetical protein
MSLLMLEAAVEEGEATLAGVEAGSTSSRLAKEISPARDAGACSGAGVDEVVWTLAALSG